MADIRTHYLDTSALVRLLVKEECSAALLTYIGPHATRFVTSLCFAETLGVLKAKRFRKKDPELSAEQYLSACEELMAHVRNGTLEIEDIRISQKDTYDEVEHLASKYSLDTSDAFQLVTLKRGILSSLEGESRPILVTADENLAKAAKSEGLRAWDCVHDAPP
jgi:predicted nucleic acid-binding protein